MVNAGDIIASVTTALVIPLASFYLFAIYCHRTHIPIQPTNVASATPLSSKC